MVAQTQVTIGVGATKVGPPIQWFHIDRLCRRGLIPYTRAGRIRLIALSDLELIREACRKAGYLKVESEVVA